MSMGLLAVIAAIVCYSLVSLALAALLWTLLPREPTTEDGSDDLDATVSSVAKADLPFRETWCGDFSGTPGQPATSSSWKTSGPLENPATGALETATEPPKELHEP